MGGWVKIGIPLWFGLCLVFVVLWIKIFLLVRSCVVYMDWRQQPIVVRIGKGSVLVGFVSYADSVMDQDISSCPF